MNKINISKIEIRTFIINLLMIILGVFSAAFGLESFLIPNGFIDGGVTGISLLLNNVFNIPVSYLIFLLNIPFIFMGYKQVGHKFAIMTFVAICILSVVLNYVHFPIITSDKLLISIFGGLFLGMGIGFSVRGGAVIDGTEILAIYVNKKTSLSMGDVILIINMIIFSVAALVLGLETAMYSILTYFSASKAVDFIIQGVEEYMGITIISTRSTEIKECIINKMGRGVTIYKGERGFGSGNSIDKELNIVFTVITRLEVARLKLEVEKIDEKAFILMNSISDVKGGMVKRRPLH